MGDRDSNFPNTALSISYCLMGDRDSNFPNTALSISYCLMGDRDSNFPNTALSISFCASASCTRGTVEALIWVTLLSARIITVNLSW